MISRVQSFGNFIFELDDTMQSLFKEPRFLEVTRHVPLLQRGLQLLTLPPVLQAALGVCPKHKPFLDPFQFNFIMQVLTPSSVIFPLFHPPPQVPGQTVAMHLDAPYFWGASRVSVPQWLLVRTRGRTRQPAATLPLSTNAPCCRCAWCSAACSRTSS